MDYKDREDAQKRTRDENNRKVRRDYRLKDKGAQNDDKVPLTASGKTVEIDVLMPDVDYVVIEGRTTLTDAYLGDNGYYFQDGKLRRRT